MDEGDNAVQYQGYSSGGSPIYQMPPNHASYVMQLTNHDKDIESFYCELLGVVRDDDGNYLRVPGKKRLINEMGANELKALLMSSLNNIIDLSSYDDFQIRELARQNLRSVGWILTLHRHDYEVHSDADRSAITTMFMNYKYAALHHAHMDRYNHKKFFGRTTQEQTIRSEIQGANTGGVLGKLKFWGK